MFEKSRHNLFVALILIFTFCAFATQTLWIQWTLIAVVTGILFMLDLMFMDQEEFVNSPNYDNWRQLKDSGLHEFDSDSSAKNKKMLFTN